MGVDEESVYPWITNKTLFEQYHHCQQGSKKVAKYINEFQKLRARNDLDENGSQEILWYITILREPIRSQVDARHVMSFH